MSHTPDICGTQPMVSSQEVMDADKICERLQPITDMNSGKTGVIAGFYDLMLCIRVGAIET